MRTEYCGKYTLDQLAPLGGSTDPNYGASCANNFIFLETLLQRLNSTHIRLLDAVR